jgi:hypothetical protein
LMGLDSRFGHQVYFKAAAYTARPPTSCADLWTDVAGPWIKQEGHDYNFEVFARGQPGVRPSLECRHAALQYIWPKCRPGPTGAVAETMGIFGMHCIEAEHIPCTVIICVFEILIKPSQCTIAARVKSQFVPVRSIQIDSTVSLCVNLNNAYFKKDSGIYRF